MIDKKDKSIYIIIAMVVFLILLAYWFFCNVVVEHWANSIMNLIALEILFFAPLFLVVLTYSVLKKKS